MGSGTAFNFLRLRKEGVAYSGDPFDVTPPNENPSGAGTFVFNMRRPGQYYDKSTNLFYNYHRDYDPQTGRYIQSDPIGMAGGVTPMGMSAEIQFRVQIRQGLNVTLMVIAFSVMFQGGHPSRSLGHQAGLA